ncbi:hypothetical protein CKA32_006434 [Geitlerinema sp. FC II]|nr:hypothetical protein CKA32_006434 [Geitlerinema sp. FC II]
MNRHVAAQNELACKLDRAVELGLCTLEFANRAPRLIGIPYHRLSRQDKADLRRIATILIELQRCRAA